MWWVPIAGTVGICVLIAMIIWLVKKISRDEFAGKSREGWECSGNSDDGHDCETGKTCLWRNEHANRSTDPCKMTGPGAEGNVHGGNCYWLTTMAECGIEDIAVSCVEAVETLADDPTPSNFDDAAYKCNSSYACVHAIVDGDTDETIKQCSSAIAGGYLLGQLPGIAAVL